MKKSCGCICSKAKDNCGTKDHNTSGGRNRGIEAVLFDLDGTIYSGPKALPGAEEILDALRKNGIPFAFMTNFTGYTPAQIRERLANMGLSVEEGQIITSGQVTAMYISSQKPAAKVFLIGSDAIKLELERAGCVLEHDSAADFVVVGYDPEFSYSKICKAREEVLKGAKLIGTNPDVLTPGKDGFFPDAGTMLAAVTAACATEAYICGKPNPDPVLFACKMLSKDPVRVLMVGDRLDTDIASGFAAGCVTALLLTGVTKTKDLDSVERRPDIVAEDLYALMRELEI